MKAQLEAFKSVLESSGTLTKANKAAIRKMYLDTFKKELVTNTGCKNCWMDAIIMLLSSLRENKIFMASGFVFEYKGILFTKRNITDVIAMEIMEAYPETKKHFKTY